MICNRNESTSHDQDLKIVSSTVIKNKSTVMRFSDEAAALQLEFHPQKLDEDSGQMVSVLV